MFVALAVVRTVEVIDIVVENVAVVLEVSVVRPVLVTVSKV